MVNPYIDKNVKSIFLYTMIGFIIIVLMTIFLASWYFRGRGASSMSASTVKAEERKQPRLEEIIPHKITDITVNAYPEMIAMDDSNFDPTGNQLTYTRTKINLTYCYTDGCAVVVIPLRGVDKLKWDGAIVDEERMQITFTVMRPTMWSYRVSFKIPADFDVIVRLLKANYQGHLNFIKNE